MRSYAKTLRTKENADTIIVLIESGKSLREIAKHLGCEASAIAHWVRSDAEENGGRTLAQRYARAIEIRYDQMAEELLELVRRDCTVDGKPDNALVQQLRLDVDTRQWLLSKMLRRKF